MDLECLAASPEGQSDLSLVTYLARPEACDPESWDNDLSSGAGRLTPVAGCSVDVGLRMRRIDEHPSDRRTVHAAGAALAVTLSIWFPPLHEVSWTREQSR